jgi:hypothetical protein
VQAQAESKKIRKERFGETAGSVGERQIEGNLSGIAAVVGICGVTRKLPNDEMRARFRGVIPRIGATDVQ